MAKSYSLFTLAESETTSMQIVKYSSLAVATALVQVVQAQTPDLPSRGDPLISQGSDLAIYIGLAMLVLAIAFAIKSLSSKMEHVLLLAFSLPIFLIVVLWYL